jgi:hypothetical protein
MSLGGLIVSPELVLLQALIKTSSSTTYSNKPSQCLLESLKVRFFMIYLSIMVVPWLVQP